MRTAYFTDKHFLKDIFDQWQSETSQIEKPFAFSKDALETAAIFLIYVFLFAAASLWTVKFIELLVLIINQIFFFPPLSEIRGTGVNSAGLKDFIVLMGL